MPADRKMYTRTQLVFFCALALFVCAGLGVALRLSPLWWPLTEPFRPKPNVPVERGTLTDPANVEDLQRNYARIIARRDAELSTQEQERMLRNFQGLKIWEDLKWQGVRASGNPCDLWVVHQIIHDVRPDYIIETGTGFGGCALFFADLLKDMGLEKSKVITIGEKAEIQQASEHPAWKEQVEFVEGGSIDADLVDRIKAKVKGKVVLVVLGSSREEPRVLEELRLFSPMVSPGSYIVVRDTSVANAPGAMSAVSSFLKTEPGAAFFQDTNREAMVLTFNRGGWLKRKE